MSKPKRLSPESSGVIESILDAVTSQKESIEGAKKLLASVPNPLDKMITSTGNEPWVLSENPILEEEIIREDAVIGDEFLHTLEKNTKFLEKEALEIEANRYFDDKVQEQELLIAKAHETHAKIPMGARSDITRADFREAVRSATDAIVSLENQRTSLSENMTVFLELSDRIKSRSTPLVPIVDQAALEFVPEELESLFPGAELCEEKSPLVENPTSVDSE